MNHRKTLVLFVRYSNLSTIKLTRSANKRLFPILVFKYVRIKVQRYLTTITSLKAYQVELHLALNSPNHFLKKTAF